MQVETKINFTTKSAIFSQDEIYRYTLSRTWDEGNGKLVNWLMLNPSTADANFEDPTIRRCCLFSKLWGYSGIIITNIFAYRDTSPDQMKKYHSPIGPENNRYILDVANSAGIIIAAWGTHGQHFNRANEVIKILKGIKLYCLEKTKDGYPKHPLYLKKELVPIEY